MEEQSANPPGRQDESRRYRILEVVGEGGFGKVYRARLEGAEGFAKDVAIKLLSDDEAPEIVLQRFRDESRILGLVRDRAIVTVDPPTRLDGRWAVVMEFVDGVNCQVLMKRSPLPPRTAMEIVQEVARALDNVYNQEGPDGTPLHLVHRDIKPGNIQVTPSGTVKILDFGIARAEFQARESKTTTHIGGTFGYIAPERLHGEEGPASDVYSLGIVLGALVTGRRCTTKNRTKIEEWVAQDEDLAKVWALSKRMAHVDPEERPSAREVEDECAALGPTLRGEPLRRWAEQNVQAKPDFIEDHLIGNVLTETMAHVPMFSTTAELPIHTRRTTTISRVPWVMGGFAFVLIGLGGLVSPWPRLPAGHRSSVPHAAPGSSSRRPRWSRCPCPRPWRSPSCRAGVGPEPVAAPSRRCGSGTVCPDARAASGGRDLPGLVRPQPGGREDHPGRAQPPGPADLRQGHHRGAPHREWVPGRAVGHPLHPGPVTSPSATSGRG
ncbi:MAG: protein kinase [Alphaproteobacteria bacterium]|nr:protein kinase [Alphaproteobacteria bacterium]